jgi:hypothetical protein
MLECNNGLFIVAYFIVIAALISNAIFVEQQSIASEYRAWKN